MRSFWVISHIRTPYSPLAWFSVVLLLYFAIVLCPYIVGLDNLAHERALYNRYSIEENRTIRIII